MRSILLFVLCTASLAHGQTAMFRGTPDHLSSQQNKKQIFFTGEAWQFNADAPVRSTAVASRDKVYFGSSRGIFYALDKSNGHIRWQYATGSSIESSPALDRNKVFFTDNQQCLYALQADNGKLLWKHVFGPGKTYPWGFDYYYSSPTIAGNSILVGAKDGFVYRINKENGRVEWKSATAGIARSTPAVDGQTVYIGDTDGLLYALDLATGKPRWQFATVGNGLKNEDFGFDRRALISSPVIKGNKVIVGGRDGFFYCVDAGTGKELWRVDHEVSWVISSLAISDTLVVTGTSDGRFVQAVSLQTGKNIWKTKTNSIVWSSPVIYNGQVYIGSGEGILYCLDLFSGRILNRFQTSGSIFSSPSISDSLLFFGADNGRVYALKNGRPRPSSATLKRFVYWEPGVNGYFRPGTDMKLRAYLASGGYKILNALKLDSVLQQDAENTVIVFASNYFPQKIMEGYERSSLRGFLNRGGRVVVCGINPVVSKFDAAKNFNGFNFLLADSVLGIRYGPNDLRSHKGIYPAFATPTGTEWGLKKFWISPLGLEPAQVDVVLGRDENGMAAAWLKKYSDVKGGGFVQIWLEQEGSDDLSYILKVAEYGFE